MRLCPLGEKETQAMPFEKDNETADKLIGKNARDRSSVVVMVRFQNSESGIECEYPSESAENPSYTTAH